MLKPCGYPWPICHQVWLSQANLLDQDCMAVIAAPLVPGEVFGPPAEAALDQSRRTRELT